MNLSILIWKYSYDLLLNVIDTTLINIGIYVLVLNTYKLLGVYRYHIQTYYSLFNITYLYL